MGISGLAESQPSNKTWGYSDVTPPQPGIPKALGRDSSRKKYIQGKGEGWSPRERL